MNANVTIANVKTSPEAGKPAIETTINFDWSGMSPEDIRALAQQSLVIKLQGQWRRNGIPTGEVNVATVDYKPGTRQPRGPVNVDKAIEAMTPEQKQAMVAKLLAQLGG